MATNWKLFDDELLPVKWIGCVAKQQAVKLSGQDEELVETINGMTEVELYNKHLWGCGYAMI